MNSGIRPWFRRLVDALPALPFGGWFVIEGAARVEVFLYLGIMTVGLAALVLPSWGLHRAI